MFRPTGGFFEHTEPSVTVHPGDVIHYWLTGIAADGGHLLKGQTYTVPGMFITLT